jgi:uncharacterized protein
MEHLSMGESFDPLILAVAAVAFFLGGVLKGVIGLGMPLVAIPLISIVMPVAKAIPLMVLPGFIMNLIQMRQAWNGRMPLRTWWPLLLGMASGVMIGGYFAASAPESLMRGILGGAVVGFVALNFTRIELPARHVESPVTGLGMGGITGLFGGMTGVFGPTLAMYFLARRLEKERFVWIMAVVMLTGVVFLGGTLSAMGGFSREQVMGTLVVLLPSWLGLTAGAWVRRRVSQDRFRKIALSALFVTGASLIAGSLGFRL